MDEEALLLSTSGELPDPCMKGTEELRRGGLPVTASCLTPTVLLATILASFGSLTYGFIVGYSSPAESGIMEDLGLSLTSYSVFGSILTIGGMVGAILSGKIADFLGRRGAMWSAQVFCSSGWFIIAFAKDAWWLDFGRLIMGLGAGIITYTVPVYIAEITPKHSRGSFTCASQLLSTTGFALAYFVGPIVSWRSLAVLSAIPSLMQLAFLFLVPESPRWLISIGRGKDFEASLRSLRGRNADVSEEAADIKDYIQISQQQPQAKTLDLIDKRYTRSLTVGIGLMVLQQFSGSSAMAYYGSSIFTQAGFSGSLAVQVLAAIQIPVAILGLFLMDKFGRRALLLASSAGICFSSFLVGIAFCLQEVPQLKNFTPFLALTGILVYGTFFSIGMGGIPWIIMSEIFPMNVKAAAGSVVTLVKWSSALITTFAFNFMMEWSLPGTFFIFSGVGASGVLFVAKLVPETKGKTLEEIQALMII